MRWASGLALATSAVLMTAGPVSAQGPDPGEQVLLGITMARPADAAPLRFAITEGSAVISAVVAPGEQRFVGYQPTPEEVAAAWRGIGELSGEPLDPRQVTGLDLSIEAAFTPGAFGGGGEYLVVGSHDEPDLSIEQPLVVEFLDERGETLHGLETRLFVGRDGLGSAAGFVDPGGEVASVVALRQPDTRAWQHAATDAPSAYRGFDVTDVRTKQDAYATAQTTFCLGSGRPDITFDEPFLVAYRDADGRLVGGGRVVAPFIVPGDQCNPVRFTFFGQVDPSLITLTEILPLQRPERLGMSIDPLGVPTEDPDLSGLTTAPGSTIDDPIYLGIVPAGDGVDRSSIVDLSYLQADPQASVAARVWDALTGEPIAFAAAFTQRLPESNFDADGTFWLDLALTEDALVVADPARVAIHRFAPESLDHLSETTYTDADGEPLFVPRGIDVMSGGGSYVIADGSTSGDDMPRGATVPIEPGPGLETFSGQEAGGAFVDVSAGPAGFAVVDQQSNSVHVYDNERTLITSFGERGSGPGQFESPQGIHLTPDGTLLVADTGNDRVQVFSLVDGEATYLYSIGEGGDHAVPMRAPTSVSTDAKGNFVIGDELGMVITSAGIPLAYGAFGSSVPDGGEAIIEPGARTGPPDLRISPDGWIYQTDPRGRLIRSYDVAQATSALLGYPDLDAR